MIPSSNNPKPPSVLSVPPSTTPDPCTTRQTTRRETCSLRPLKAFSASALTLSRLLPVNNHRTWARYSWQPGHPAGDARWSRRHRGRTGFDKHEGEGGWAPAGTVGDPLLRGHPPDRFHWRAIATFTSMAPSTMRSLGGTFARHRERP